LAFKKVSAIKVYIAQGKGETKSLFNFAQEGQGS